MLKRTGIAINFTAAIPINQTVSGVIQLRLAAFSILVVL